MHEDIDKYQDDIFIHSKDSASHMARHEEVMDRARTARLCFSLKKSHFNYRRLRILGHLITAAGRTPDPEKVQAIVDLAYPKTVKEVQHFTGLVAFNRDYIPHASQLIKPLNDLISIKGNMMSYWKDEIHGKAIRGIKHALTTQPVMMLPDPAGEFRIHVDSCTKGYGCGAILLRRDLRWHAWRQRQDDRETEAGTDKVGDVFEHP
jgi:hypothetical protein